MNNTKNKKFLLTLAIVLFLLINSVLLYFSLTKKNTVNNEPIKIGLFSKNEDEYLLSNVDKIHYFSVWGKEFETKNLSILNKINAFNKPGLITLEPWPQFGEGNDRRLLLSNIKNGKYDETIKEYCSMVDKISKTKIYLRVGHEMELNESSRYPWSFSDPELFVYAYRNYVDQCKSVTNKINYVWSPAGNNKQELYYPGDKYVDTVGMSWYSYPAFEWFTYKKIIPFREIMDDKYSRVSRFNKPIMAAEFGYAGTPDQKDVIYKTLLNLKEVKKSYPLLESIVFFSDKTESWVPNIIEAPDWTITPEQLKRI
jgi:cellulose synthase (UDP-forming)